ncbi:DUF1127 domain-containing protein [Roseococcus sp. DSY-14]|uniref:DUF1127 domain-containing protein n=1 Tax=Roseococcus sp. DSY-14 TaxID=3369650 RepID=UPI00387B5CC7
MSAHLAPAAFAPMRRAARPAAALLAEMVRRIRTRARLAELDERLLRDVGLSPMDAAREAAKAPWE